MINLKPSIGVWVIVNYTLKRFAEKVIDYTKIKH
jgi:hypothetical protein